MENKDVRYENTTTKIFKAFQTLSLTKNIGEIYVNDLCKEAKITRQTFYRHYSDKYELFNDLVITYISDIVSANFDVASSINNPKTYMRNMLNNAINHCLENKEFFKTIFRDTELLQIVITNVEKTCLDVFNNLGTIYKFKYDVKYISCAVSGAILLLLYRWIKDRPETTKEVFLNELTKFINDIVDFDILTEKEDLVK